MKLIFATYTYGERICIRISYSYQTYFSGEQPADSKLITLDLPGLKHYNLTDVLKWLKENTDSASTISENLSSRREINEIPDNLWRETVLDDYIEAENYTETIWQIYQHFAAEDFSAFGDKWLDPARHKLKVALLHDKGKQRINAFNNTHSFLERVYYVMDKSPQRLHLEIEKMQEALDLAKLNEIRQTTDNLNRWIEVGNRFLAVRSRQKLANAIADEIVKRRLESKEIQKLLRQFDIGLRNSVFFLGSSFWEKLTPFLKFEQNVSGKEIDITEANEEKILYNWELLNAKRIGTISHDRNALVIRKNPLNQIDTVISGGRKLKFQVQKKGGRMKKFGCTLIVTSQEDASIYPALLEVETIDALANLNPKDALKKAEHLNLPSDHLIYKIAEKAKTDKRQSRVLADLLIELLVGVDADIARRLARSQSVGNRR